MLACLFVISCALFPSPAPPRTELWSSPVWRGLLAKIADAKGEPFASLRERIENKISYPPVFAAKEEGKNSDEIFLVSPRNTKIRPETWDRMFLWNLAVNGRDYILHIYSGESEVMKREMGSAHRATVSEPDAAFLPGAEYSWDVSLCVERCGLHLSSRPQLRPRFTLLSDEAGKRVAEELAAVKTWCHERGMSGSEDEAALIALTLEGAGLYMEEGQLLQKEIRRRPDSVLMHLALSSALYGMNSPWGARREYEAARALLDTVKENPTAATPK